MALVSMRDLLQDARKRKYAVGGFNVFNFETLSAVVEVAEELKTPLVLGVPERLFKFVDVETLSAAMVKVAQKSAVPIALHLDHGHSYDGIMKAIRWGFTSVMFDGSSMNLLDNLRRTKEIVRIAHSLGITVEGELGYVGCCDGLDQEQMQKSSSLEDVVDFVSKTKIDALAIAVGTNHGVVRGQAKLNFPRLGELNLALNMPLVLHGGSRLPKEEYRNSIQAGVAKINIATDMSLVAAGKLRDELTSNPGSNYIHIMSAVKKGVKDSVRKYMLEFDCISKSL
ncbi:MAG: fbaA [Firmicutes bacterium]|nr:fbaA [Bacillota bacterium]